MVELRTGGALRAVGATLRVSSSDEEDITRRRAPVRMTRVRLMSSVRLLVRMTDVKTEGEIITCCGQRLFVYVAASVCGMERCMRVYEWFEVVIKCDDPCARQVGGTPMGMSMSLRRECPICLK